MIVTSRNVRLNSGIHAKRYELNGEKENEELDCIMRK